MDTNFITADQWAEQRINYLTGWIHSCQGVPPVEWVNELAQLVNAWHGNQEAKQWEALAKFSPEKASPIKLSAVIGKPGTDWNFNGGSTGVAESTGGSIPRLMPHAETSDPWDSRELGASMEHVGVHAPADPGIQAEADPWLVIIRHNGHAWRVWESGKIEQSNHPSELFQPAGTVNTDSPNVLWFDAGVYRWLIEPKNHRVFRRLIGTNGAAETEVHPEALTWWPG